MTERCNECGDLKPLNGRGVCRWRAGCEHRQMQQEARQHRIVEEAEKVLAKASHPIYGQAFLMSLWEGEDGIGG